MARKARRRASRPRSQAALPRARALLHARSPETRAFEEATHAFDERDRDVGAQGGAAPSAQVVEPGSEDSSSSSNKLLWLASFVALGTADFGAVANVSSSALLALEGLGVAGGTGLVVTSTKDLKKSRTTEEKLDAGNNIAWGGQGLMYLFPGSAGALEVGLGLGLVGSAMQTAVGLMRVQRGIAYSDQSMIKLGALDVGSGLLWLAWDLLGLRQPLFVTAYILAKAGRESYAGRKTLSAMFGAIKKKAQQNYREATLALESAWREFEAGFEAG